MEKCENFNGEKVCLKEIIFSKLQGLVDVGSPVYFYEGNEIVKAEIMRMGTYNPRGEIIMNANSPWIDVKGLSGSIKRQEGIKNWNDLMIDEKEIKELRKKEKK